MDFREQRREAILRECEKRGIRIEQRGQAFRLIGAGVSLLVADLASLSIEALAPYTPRKGSHG